MLGLILGLMAGLIRGPPILPRFWLFRGTDLLSSLTRPFKVVGVAATKGEATADMQGLDVAEGGCMADRGVLDGPNFGVFRAAMRGVASADTGVALGIILSMAGRCACVSAAGGRTKSSSMAWSSLALGRVLTERGVLASAGLGWFWLLRCNDIKEAGVAGAPELPLTETDAGAE